MPTREAGFTEERTENAEVCQEQICPSCGTRLIPIESSLAVQGWLPGHGNLPLRFAGTTSCGQGKTGSKGEIPGVWGGKTDLDT